MPLAGLGLSLILKGPPECIHVHIYIYIYIYIYISQEYLKGLGVGCWQVKETRLSRSDSAPLAGWENGLEVFGDNKDRF